jgi:hypothetical protein
MGEEEAKKNALKDNGPKPISIIPKSAVRGEDGKPYVLLVKDTKLERRGITLGKDRGSDVEVMAGVNSGDSLVAHGPDNLQDGDAIRVSQQ